MDLPKTIRHTRIQFGLSQVRLSSLSGVSLPTLQNIEMGKANPTLETAQAILETLGLQLEFNPAIADWGYLALCGVPISGFPTSKNPVHRERFMLEMRRALVELTQSKEIADRERKLQAIQSVLLALKSQFPSQFKKLSKSALVVALMPKQLTGRLLKLRRIAESGLSKFL